MDELTPLVTGSNYVFKQGPGAWGTDTIWRLFAPLRPKTSIITGLGIAEGRASPGDHGCGMPAIFSCTKPLPKGSKLGKTIDQYMADKYAGPDPALPKRVAARDGEGLFFG